MLDGAFTSPKIRRLAVVLGVPWPHALGLAGLLWRFSAKHAPTGEIGLPRRRGDRGGPRMAGRRRRPGRRSRPMPPPRSDRFRRSAPCSRLAGPRSEVRLGYAEAAEIAVFGGVSTIDYSRHYSPHCSPHYSRPLPHTYRRDYLYLCLCLHLFRLRLRCA
jgi:hypothetical protein